MPFLDVFGINILAEDKTKPAIDSAVKGTTRLEQAQAGVTEAIKTGSREMMAMGHNLTSLGTFLIVASTNMGEFKGIAEGAGMALGGIGSAITLLGETMRIAKIFMYGQMLPALIDFAAALWAAYAAEIAVTGGLALIGGTIALYIMHTQAVTKAQDDLTSGFRRTEDALKDLNNLFKEQVDIQHQLAGIPEDMAKAELAHQSAILDVADAQDKMNEATTTYGLGSREYQRAAIAHDEALLREEETQKDINDLTSKRITLQAKEKETAYLMPQFQQRAEVESILGGIAATQKAAGAAAPLGPVAGAVSFFIQTLLLSPNDTVQAWAEREQRFRSGVPTI